MMLYGLIKRRILEVASGVPGIDVDKLKTDIEQKSDLGAVNKDTELVEEFNSPTDSNYYNKRHYARRPF